ncbi:MAG: AMP-binding protein, partial [Burkholderiales bacterium]|nr:AMP-binding protein [Burkholderiales bacterium]
MRHVAAGGGPTCADYPALYRWSIDRPAEFWRAVWDFCGVRANRRGDRVLEHPERMPGARWFPDARLNYAENLLQRDSDEDAIVFRGENRVDSRVSFRELRHEVSRMAQALRAAGIRPGDRVAGYMPNLPGTVIAMLAATSLGAVWSSCSPDFGVQGVVDRFGQIGPRILFAADGYFYNNKAID